MVGYFVVFFSSMVMYLYISQSISVAKSCGGGWRKSTSCGRLLWENLFHDQCILSECPCNAHFDCICMVCLFVRISLSELHS